MARYGLVTWGVTGRLLLHAAAVVGRRALGACVDVGSSVALPAAAASTSVSDSRCCGCAANKL